MNTAVVQLVLIILNPSILNKSILKYHHTNQLCKKNTHNPLCKLRETMVDVDLTIDWLMGNLHSAIHLVTHAVEQVNGVSGVEKMNLLWCKQNLYHRPYWRP